MHCWIIAGRVTKREGRDQGPLVQLICCNSETAPTGPSPSNCCFRFHRDKESWLPSTKSRLTCRLGLEWPQGTPAWQVPAATAPGNPNSQIYWCRCHKTTPFTNFILNASSLTWEILSAATLHGSGCTWRSSSTVTWCSLSETFVAFPTLPRKQVKKKVETGQWVFIFRLQGFDSVGVWSG